MDQEMSRRTLRLPQDVSEFIVGTARHRSTSMNSEIVRILRDRMTAATGETLQGETPAAAQNDDRVGRAVAHQPRF